MPVGPAGASGGGAGGQRQNFRPPWVKDGVQAAQTPAAPWTLANRNKEQPQAQQQTPQQKTQQKPPEAEQKGEIFLSDRKKIKDAVLQLPTEKWGDKNKIIKKHYVWKPTKILEKW